MAEMSGGPDSSIISIRITQMPANGIRRNPVFACWQKKLDGDKECAVDKCPIGAMSALLMDCLRSIEHVSSCKKRGEN